VILETPYLLGEEATFIFNNSTIELHVGIASSHKQSS